MVEKLFPKGIIFPSILHDHGQIESIVFKARTHGINQGVYKSERQGSSKANAKRAAIEEALSEIRNPIDFNPLFMNDLP